MIYGYARVSTHGQAKDGNSLDAQAEQLQSAGAEKIYSDEYTGTKADRPQFVKLLADIRSGDTLIVTKLDRFARSVSQGIDLINTLNKKGVTVNVLNIGVIGDTPTGRLTRNIFLAFAEFERDMIVERTTEGKRIARTKPDFKEGRPHKYSKEQIQLALTLLQDNTYSSVEKMTGISKASLVRYKREYDVKCNTGSAEGTAAPRRAPA